MTETDSTETLTGLFEQVARRLHSSGFAAQLFPAQWSALRYIHQAAVERRTSIDLARFQGLASGAVARTVRTLIEKGLVEKKGTIGRGRAEQLQLTEKGQQMLKRDPLRSLRRAMEDLSLHERAVLAKGLETAIDATRPQRDRL
ncbi:MarR family transcriptional regulator [Jiella sp. MQZ9-1]|uniref:MarR family transcriptional regulator n=1 Tax=Jiella flava TaxID=2816857 RepID=A0A939JV80_9HYPH|nr:MarR family transcriptional regulator [Jiella flava]MBO0662164.1 MarR family transcriptional regulator [Jiella flava]MCD2471006.1 MarR family transcriptional regulator [Jiella flava]